MIPYAHSDTRRDVRFPRFIEYSHLFRGGKDTKQIADAFGIDEAIVHYGVNIVRSQMRGLPSPYRKRGAAS